MAITLTRITRCRGDTRPIARQFISKATGSPVDVTGWAGLLTVTSLSEPTTADSQVFQSAMIIVDGNTGKAAFPLTPMQANNVGDYYYDIQLTDTDGYLWTPERGEFVMLQDRTK